MRTVLVASLALSTAVADAQVGGPPGLTPPSERHAARKTTTTAMWLTLGTTAAGAGLFFLGESLYQTPGCYNSCYPQQAVAVVGGAAFFVGPSLGHVYAGHTWNAGLGLRLGGIAAFGLGWLAMAPCFAHPANAGDQSQSCQVGGIAVTGGAIATLVGTVYEIASTPDAVHAYNREHGFDATLSVAPVRTRDGGVVPTVGLAVRF